MKLGMTAFAGALAITAIMMGAPKAHAQGSAFPDVPANHWAYQAVKDLGDKGFIKGYPNGQFLGSRALTRYEFATVIDRVLQTIADLTKAQAAPGAEAPRPTGVTQDDLNKIQVLVDKFDGELTTIQSDVAAAQASIDSLRQDVLDTKEIAAKAQDTANSSYGVGANRKFAISGYIQARYQAADSNNKGLFPPGVPATTGGAAYNGDYAAGGNADTLVLRRARLKFAGAVTNNTKYAVQIDASGATTVGGQSVTVREGYVAYTLGDGSVTNPTLQVGMFQVPFGYQLGTTASVLLTPERPLAFNESGGLWNNQEYDRGAVLTVVRGPFKALAGVLNGTGLTSNDINTHLDSIYRLAYSSPSKTFNAGATYYAGQIQLGTGTGLAYQGGKKNLYGFDAQYSSPAGPFLNAEYIAGQNDQRNFFDKPATGQVFNLRTNVPARGNNVAGYYIQPGFTFSPVGAHPLTLAASYDVFQRSKSGLPDSGGTYDDVNIGYGVLYGLDKATRLRVWYEKPTKVAHSPAIAEPEKIGIFTTEVQVKY